MHASQVKCSIMRAAETVMGGRDEPLARRTNHLLVSPTRVMNVIEKPNSERIFYDDIQD